MITLKLAIAIIAFVLSGGQIVFQTFQHHHAVNPKHGGVKFLIFLISSLSLIYLAKDIYADFENDKIAATAPKIVTSQTEIDYWHNVYRNPSPEGYCEYLEKFPNGQFIDIAKNGIPNRDCFAVKRQTEAESRKKAEADAVALKEKIENETKALAEKNAQLEKEAKENSARIAALEQAKTEVELKAQSQFATDMKMEAELKAMFESDNSATPQTPAPASESKPDTKLDESLF